MAKIFYFGLDDKVWHGPLTELEVQGWYVNGYFVSDVKFQISSHDEFDPNGSVYTLGELIDRNGRQNPFYFSRHGDLVERLNMLSLKDLEATKSSLQAEIVAKDAKIVQVEATKSSLQAAIVTKDAKIAELEALKLSQQESIATKDSKISGQGKLLNSLESRLKNEEDSKSVLIEKLKNIELELKTKRNNGEKSKAAEIKKLKKELEATKSSLQAEIATKAAKIAELESIKSSQQEMIAAKDSKILKQNKYASSLESKFKNEKDSKSAEIENLKNEIKSTKSSLEAAIANNSSLMLNIESLKKSVKLRDAKENEHITETTIRARFTEISKLSKYYVYSQPIRLAGTVWRLFLRKKNDHLEVYLNGMKPTVDKWSCSVFFDLQLISQENNTVTLAISTKHTFDGNHGSKGYSTFISFQDLNDEKKGFVKDDSIIIASEIKIFSSNMVGIAPEKSSLQEEIMTNSPLIHNIEITETTIRARFTEISKLSETYVYSQPTRLAGFDWFLFVVKENDHLYVYVNGKKPNAEKWSCSAFFNMHLISQKDKSIVDFASRGNESSHTFNEKSKGWGYQFISFKDLLDEKNGYVMDDSIILAAKITVFPSTRA